MIDQRAGSIRAFMEAQTQQTCSESTDISSDSEQSLKPDACASSCAVPQSPYITNSLCTSHRVETFEGENQPQPMAWRTEAKKEALARRRRRPRERQSSDSSFFGSQWTLQHSTGRYSCENVVALHSCPYVFCGAKTARVTPGYVPGFSPHVESAAILWSLLASPPPFWHFKKATCMFFSHKLTHNIIIIITSYKKKKTVFHTSARAQKFGTTAPTRSVLQEYRLPNHLCTQRVLHCYRCYFVKNENL